jgi:hypothetical protein
MGHYDLLPRAFDDYVGDGITHGFVEHGLTFLSRATAMPYQNLARIESGFVDLH